MLKHVRPQEVNQWSGGDRKLKDVPIVDLPVFIVKWHKWWSQLQPSSRRDYVSDGLLEPNVSMDWSRMQKWGKDGMVMVMIALVWWGKVSETDARWLKAVQDISKVLHCMQDHPPTVGPSATTQPRVNRKRKVPEIENPDGADIRSKRPLRSIQ